MLDEAAPIGASPSQLTPHRRLLLPPPPMCSLGAHEEFVLQEVEVSVVLDVKEEPANKV